MLELRNISKTYTQGQEQISVLNNVQLKLGAGEKIAIIGPSGSGKSTLLSIMAGLEKPTEGEVLYEGKNFWSLSETEQQAYRRKAIGFIFQAFELIPSFTALENVMLPLEINGSPDESKAQQMLEATEMEHRLNFYPSQLSGGEQQRVGISRALVHHPQFIFADEPTGNLDDRHAEQIFRLLLDSVGPRQTLIVVTHNTELANKTDTVYRLHEGRLTGFRE